MLTCIFCFLAGLVIGWNFLPQPAWVKDIVGKMFGKNNGDTNVQHTPSTKNYASPNFHWKGPQINKPFGILRTNDSKKYTNNTEKPIKLAQTLGNHQISQINCIP